MDDRDEEIVVPVIREEVHVDAVPVLRGGVRVTKRVDQHEEILEQELCRGRAEVKRIKTERVVDGPQQPSRVGNTIVIPVVSEIYRIEKQWIVTEEIHITQLEDREKVQHRVNVNAESVEIERLDADGRVVATDAPPTGARASRSTALDIESGSGAVHQPEIQSKKPERSILSGLKDIITGRESETRRDD